MANTINSNFSLHYKTTMQLGGKKNREKPAAKDPFEQYGGGTTVDISEEGLAALRNQRKQPVQNDESGAAKPDEEKLSAKAKDFLGKLREKYGDYDFYAVEKIGDPFEMTKGSTKSYSVILTNDEIERMANDEEYAAKVMGKVESAVGMTKRIEEKGELGEGVSFKHIAVTFDDDGNMKLFAELEKMSEQQKERMEKAKEKKAEDKKAEGKKKTDEPPNAKKPKIKPQRVRLEADSEEDLLKKISEIDWNKKDDEKVVLFR